MKKLFLTSLCLFFFQSAVACIAKPKEARRGSAYEFTFTSINGAPLPLSNYQGKVIMIVNTASRCGFTPQYADLQKIWLKYRDRGFVILGVPSGDFGGQELEDDAAIKEFCEVNFDIDFPMTQKASVRGPEAHPFYTWAQGMLGGIARPRWNFHKYLINSDGDLVGWFSSFTSPASRRVTRSIEDLLP